jgi:ribosome-associated heat shock protein Hsp15
MPIPHSPNYATSSSAGDHGIMTEPGLRIDKWLWQARFFKSRSLANRHCAGGRVRVNGNRVTKSHTMVRPGDVLTFPKGPRIQVVQIKELGTRRGPASEAVTLYEDLSPPVARVSAPKATDIQGQREKGAGRPTKSDRRATDRLKGD